jgi:hypothetical protein
MKRKALSNRQRFEVFKRDFFTCQYCGKSAPDVILHVDHIKPVNNGGTNEITNLVTSCFECNSGKSDKTLSDDSAVKKQMTQLALIQQRKEQIDMIAEWAISMNIDHEIEAINKIITAIDNTTLTSTGIKNIKKLINKYGFQVVAEYIPKSYAKYGSGYMNQLHKLLNYSHASEDDRHFMYSIGILKKRLSYYDKHKSAIMVSTAKDYGMTKEYFREVCLNSKNWTDYREFMNTFIENAKYKQELI